MGNIIVKTCTVGQVQTNCYIIFHKELKEAVLIDPGDHASFLMQKCKELGVTVAAILLTHGHFDHIGAVNELHETLKADIYAGKEEDDLLQDPSLNLSWSYLNDKITIIADRFLDDGEEFELIGTRWKLIATPGHTAGSVCYLIPDEKILVSGDTLFLESLGRTDMPTGNISLIIDSITKKLFVLPDETIVYPGHGDSTTIEHEKLYNPVAQYNKG